MFFLLNNDISTVGSEHASKDWVNIAKSQCGIHGCRIVNAINQQNGLRGNKVAKAVETEQTEVRKAEYPDLNDVQHHQAFAKRNIPCVL